MVNDKRGNLLNVNVRRGENEYGSVKDLEGLILYKRITYIDKDKIELENGITLTIECSEQECCAGGDGVFEFDEEMPPLDAVITDFRIGDQKEIPYDYTDAWENTITFFHNQNKVAKANAETDAGNGGYYYSITSLVVNGLHFPFVEA